MTVSDIKSLFCFTDEGLIMINAGNDVELCARKTHQDTEEPFSLKPALQLFKVKTKSGERGMEEEDVNDCNPPFFYCILHSYISFRTRMQIRGRSGLCKCDGIGASRRRYRSVRYHSAGCLWCRFLHHESGGSNMKANANHIWHMLTSAEMSLFLFLFYFIYFF